MVFNYLGLYFKGEEMELMILIEGNECVVDESRYEIFILVLVLM